jgi:hypothetical protein
VTGVILADASGGGGVTFTPAASGRLSFYVRAYNASGVVELGGQTTSGLTPFPRAGAYALHLRRGVGLWTLSQAGSPSGVSSAIVEHAINEVGASVTFTTADDVDPSWLVIDRYDPTHGNSGAVYTGVTPPRSAAEAAVWIREAFPNGIDPYNPVAQLAIDYVRRKFGDDAVDGLGVDPFGPRAGITWTMAPEPGAGLLTIGLALGLARRGRRRDLRQS